jgi:hypothetical protein
MLYRLDNIPAPQVNFWIGLKDKYGRVVEHREIHNVFTNIGRDWLAHLVAWHSIGAPDVPVTMRRVRWIGLGTGTTQEELATVTELEVPTVVTDAGYYIAILDETEFPAVTTPPFPEDTVSVVRFKREFDLSEISLDTNPAVPVSEAGLFVDVHPAQAPPTGIGGEDDSPFAGLDTTLDPSAPDNGPVAYARFLPLTKTQDFALEVRWDFRF